MTLKEKVDLNKSIGVLRKEMYEFQSIERNQNKQIWFKSDVRTKNKQNKARATNGQFSFDRIRSVC